MSLNTAHANNGVLIHAGEGIILFSENVNMEFSGQDGPAFKGTKNGRIYLTTHRMVFNSRTSSDPLQSFSFPFVCLTDVEVEQPVFGANYIRGKVRAQENGNFKGEAKFKLLFKAGGAIEFAQAALKAAYIAKKYGNNAAPPPYTPPTGAWHEAPPPAYSPNPSGYYGWIPDVNAFPNRPPPNSVFISDNPPPYPGIVQPGQVPTPNGFAGGPPMYPGGFGDSGLPAYPGAQTPGYPGYPSAGQPPYAGGQAIGGGYPGPAQQPGYPMPPAPGGYAAYAGGGQPGYPSWGNPGYQPQGQFTGGPTSSVYPQIPNGNAAGGYPPSTNPTGAMGFSGPPNTKEQEAAQSAYNPGPNPNQPQPMAPPEYYEPPPSYNSLANKKQQ